MRQSSDFVSLNVFETLRRLGERVRVARKAQKLSLSDLERSCRIHRTTLGRLERGEPGVSISVLLTVLEHLGVLSDLELVLSTPEQPKRKREAAKPTLFTDF